MAFFGLTEEQVKMQALFEYTFPLKFMDNFYQYNETRASGYKLSSDKLRKIEQLNRLVSY